MKIWITDGSGAPFADLVALPAHHPGMLGGDVPYQGALDENVPVGNAAVFTDGPADCLVPEAEWCICFPRDTDQVAASLLQGPDVGAEGGGPGVIPRLQVIEQPAAQPTAPWPSAVPPSWRRRTRPAAGSRRGLLLFLGEHPPNAAGAVVPADKHPARARHAVSLPTYDLLPRRSVCAAGQPACTQVSRCTGPSGSDREFPPLTGRPGTRHFRRMG